MPLCAQALWPASPWRPSIMRNFRFKEFALIFPLILLVIPLFSAIFGTVRGIAHDPDHRPVPDANVSVRSVSSEYQQTGKTDSNGEFQFAAVPLGEYQISVTRDGFAPVEQSV